MKAAIYLHQAKQSAAQRGHPWIFPKSIARQLGTCLTGELVEVYNADNILLGLGVYNEESLYRVRMLVNAFEPLTKHTIADIVSYRLKQAVQLRDSLNLPNNKTNAYRLLNSEGDGLSGLTIDYFNQVAVVASSAYWVEANQIIISQLISEITGLDQIVWLPQTKPLLQDGWSKSSLPVLPVEHQTISEAGVQFLVHFSSSQKTGLFLDQRENHERIAVLARGKRVLDLYTYTGGFALHAALAKAALVTAVDSSSQAIAAAKHNAQLNGLTEIEWVVGDARDYLHTAGDYDIVILDPPKLVPSQKHKERAKNYYRFLHREIFKSMKTGSILMTCNCSSALSTEEFTQLVAAQAWLVGKVVRILGIYGPAGCHPMLATFPEGRYLTALLLAIV